MVISLDLTGARAASIVAGTSPLAELMACLHVLAEPDHHPESRTWANRVSAALSDELRAELARFSPLWSRYRARLFYPFGLELDRTLDQELDELASLGEQTVLPHFANAIRGSQSPALSAEQVRAGGSWVAYSAHRSVARGDLADAFVADPSALRSRLEKTLRECAESFFDEEWSRSRARLLAASAVVRTRLADPQVALVSLMEGLSRIASARGSATTVHFDKLQSSTGRVADAGMVLVPSLRGWPHVMVKTDPGLPVVVHFLAEENVTGAMDNTQDRVRRRLLVLAEPGRWELCRHMLGESITTTELARRTRQTVPAVSRHLRLMREVGLVESERDGRQVFYRMNAATILQLGADVLGTILR